MMNYLRGVLKEFKNIKWPTTKITIYYTIGVISVALLLVAFIGVLDLGFVNIVNKYLI